MIEESVFECCEIDEEEDYHKEFNEIIKKIIKYFEAELGVNFTEEEYYLQAIDVYDCNYIKYVADINNSENLNRIKDVLLDFENKFKP